MRKVVLYTLMSLDGAVDHPSRYFAPSPDGVPTFDDVMDQHERRIIDRQDTVLLGRGMYDEWSQFWPGAQHEPFAPFINGVQKYVVTSRPLTTPWHNTEPVAGPVSDVVQDLKARDGGDIGVHGSIVLAKSLLAGGLVDELQLVIGPTIGCEGRRLLDGPEGLRRLELTGCTPTPSGSVLLTYRL